MDRKDVELRKKVALPAAEASASTPSIDIGQVTAYPINRHFEARVTLPELANLADTKTAVVTLEDSADNSSFAAISGVGTLTITGAGGAGAAGDSLDVILPDSTRQYVRATVAVDAAGGDNTADELTFELVF